MAEWILPANRYYHAYEALRDLGKIEWVQNSKLSKAEPGDIAYIYECSPVKAIRWKCRITAVDRQTSIIDDSAYSDNPVNYPGPYLEIETVFDFPFFGELSLDTLRHEGYKGNMQGPCPVSAYPGLAKYLHQTESAQTSASGLESLCAKTSLLELRKLAKAQERQRPKTAPLHTSQYVRSPTVSFCAKKRANGICELCGRPGPFLVNNDFYLEVHHVQWLSQGGGDTLANTVALCPNCHRKMHMVNDPKDAALLRNLHINE